MALSIAPDPGENADDGLADDDEPTPAIRAVRETLAARRDGSPMGKRQSGTIPNNPLTREEKRAADLFVYPPDIQRPRTRADCANVPRPCPFVSCSHNLYLDVDQNTGSIHLNAPELDPHEMEKSCALDEADRGGMRLHKVGEILRITRERVRQIEAKALRKIAAHSGARLGIATPIERADPSRSAKR